MEPCRLCNGSGYWGLHQGFCPRCVDFRAKPMVDPVSQPKDNCAEISAPVTSKWLDPWRSAWRYKWVEGEPKGNFGICINPPVVLSERISHLPGYGSEHWARDLQCQPGGEKPRHICTGSSPKMGAYSISRE